tara:strand:+ start:182 stop:1147 length:966 start_codon:yes stop_codon:yes gene_type:complete
MTAQREVFIQALFEKAKNDKDIVLISVDMGAGALDKWREELPEQFFTTGIAEQNAINFAAGQAAQGKKVFVFLMACWAARCLEQIRYSCAVANNSITILANGIGLGYAPSGPAHCPTEDIAYMRSINNIEIITPANSNFTMQLVDYILDNPKLRHLRLERNYAKEMESYYAEDWSGYDNFDSNIISQGINPIKLNGEKAALLSCGYMLGRTINSQEQLLASGTETSVYDIWQAKNIDIKLFYKTFNIYEKLITVEEQSLSGGFGSMISELNSDSRLNKPLLRIGLPDKYIFENGSRDHLLDTNGLSVNNIYKQCARFVNNK